MARYKQKSWAKKVVRITLETVHDLHLPIDYLGNQITLHQALVCCRTSAMGDFRLFSSVNYIPATGECVAVCTSTSEDKANSVIENLIPLCNEHFGPSVKYWFTDEAWQENIHCSYNRQTKMIDEDVVYETSKRALLIAAFGPNLECSDSSSINSNSDLKIDSVDKPPTKFILPHLFQLTPNDHGALDQDDNNSLGTMATGTSNATTNIAEDLKNVIDITGDNVTVMSNLTNTTGMASPLFKSPSTNNEHSDNSPMELENKVGQAVENLERKIHQANVSPTPSIPLNHNTNPPNLKTLNSAQQPTPASTTVITTTNVNDPTNHNNTLSIIPTPPIEPRSHENNPNQERKEEFPPPKAVGPPPDPKSDSQQQTGDKVRDAG